MSFKNRTIIKEYGIFVMCCHWKAVCIKWVKMNTISNLFFLLLLMAIAIILSPRSVTAWEQVLFIVFCTSPRKSCQLGRRGCCVCLFRYSDNIQQTFYWEACCHTIISSRANEKGIDYVHSVCACVCVRIYMWLRLSLKVVLTIATQPLTQHSL